MRETGPLINHPHLRTTKVTGKYQAGMNDSQPAHKLSELFDTDGQERTKKCRLTHGEMA